MGFLPFFSVQATPQKKALIIAIGSYQDKKWTKLASEYDLKLMTTMLIRQGFESSNILSIFNKEATKDNIKKKIEKLVKMCRKGDCIMIHFSGHGQQLQDLNQDELDGFDESLVPYDAPNSNINTNYRGEKHIIDDEIALWIKSIKDKIGEKGHLLMTLDCCHSGTASRGNAIVRGTAPPMMFTKLLSNSKDYGKMTHVDSPKKSVNEATFVLIAGAKAKQKSTQTIDDQGYDIGSLTYALIHVFENISQTSTYKEMLQTINDIYKVKIINQSAECEGDTENFVFGGNVIVQERTFTVSRIIDEVRKKILISAGSIKGLIKGSKVDIQNKNQQKTVTRGQVVESNNFESIIQLEDVLSSEDHVCVISEQALTDYQLKIGFNNFNNHTIKNQILGVFHNSKIIFFNQKINDFELEKKGNQIDILNSRTGDIFQSIILEGQWELILRKKIMDLAKATALSRLDISNHVLNADIYLENKAKKEYIFSTKDSATFIVRNTGAQAFYFTLIDIQPNAIVNIVFPNIENGYSAHDLYLEPGEEKRFLIGSFTPPLGVELFKVFLSDKPLSLKLDGNGIFRNSSIPTSPIELFFESLNDNTLHSSGTRDIIKTIPSDNIRTKNLTFEIIK